MPKEYKVLTQEEVDFFMENGYVVVKNAFTKEQANDYMSTMWLRLGLDPSDKSTWEGHPEKIHMPPLRRTAAKEFSPKAWGAMCDLLGGEERIAISERSSWWNDNFIVNLGAREYENDKLIDPHTFTNWHVDGDWFVHYLDSPEQALLVTPVFTKIEPRGGATYICPEGIDKIAQYLAAHPEGVLPTGCSFTPVTSTFADHTQDPGYISTLAVGAAASRHIEMNADVGDVVLTHPLMVHSASKNHTRIPRVITNPAVSVNEPFCFDRENHDDYSLVELKTLKALGVDRFSFKPTTERRRIVPKRQLIMERMQEEERKRLAQIAAEKGIVVPAIMSEPLFVV